MRKDLSSVGVRECECDSFRDSVIFEQRRLNILIKELLEVIVFCNLFIAFYMSLLQIINCFIVIFIIIIKYSSCIHLLN